MSTSLNIVDLEEIKVKLYEKLKPSGWGDKLKTFIMSKDFDNILSYLLNDVKNGKRFTPILKYVFRAFEECPYKDLKIVMIGQEPYPYEGVSDGIAFSGGIKNKVETSLKYIFKEIETTVHPNGYTWDPDLKRWSNQGILLLNSALTTNFDKQGQHYELWKSFLTFVFDTLNYQNPGLIYVFMGRKAQEWSDFISENNFKLYTSHPASAAHNGLESWDSEDIFNRISELSIKHYDHTIIW